MASPTPPASSPTTEPASPPSARREGARPVLLTVDDDPSVSRSVARDLRRRYGGQYRVVRAESAADALDALGQVVVRGEPVALLLADMRMPEMDGIAFLEAAMDLAPTARRALLTAYADTSAAIAAINVVDVDHYLLKPWSPPEEKLYPVVDAMLDTWRRNAQPPPSGVRLVGHRWSAASFEVRDFLARNQVPYRWVPADSPEGQRLLAAADRGGDPNRVPLVVTADGTALLAPGLADVAAAVGLETSATVARATRAAGANPTDDGADSSTGPAASPSAAATSPGGTTVVDVAVVGAGPAGLGAAVYATSEGLRTVVAEAGAVGGQAGQSSRIENYLGFPEGISGSQLTDRARRQATRFGATLLSASAITRLGVDSELKTLHFADGTTLAAHAVVLATGVSYRRLGAPGVDELTGRGVFYGSALTQADECADREVVIVGGANSAGQAAVFFSSVASRVTMLVRGSSLTKSMSSYLIEQLAAIDTIDVRTCSQVVAAHPAAERGPDGEEHLGRVTVLDTSTGERREIDTGHLFVFIGAEPRTEWLGETVERDPAGFVLTGPELLRDGERPLGWPLERDPYLLETSVPGVFAAGDVRAGSVKRVASAVGEGALAVVAIHRYLGAS